MFTGLIQAVGRIGASRPAGGGRRLVVTTEVALEDVVLGESIAVDGACLTVTEIGERSFAVEVSPETLERTTLGERRADDRVHLERALRVSDRLGGHIVTGHVDGTARLLKSRRAGDYTLLEYELPAALAPLVVEKGSIAVDGVSLTVNGVVSGRFEVAIIPHTAEHTHLTEPARRHVNLETDVLAKHVARLVETWRQRA